MPKLRRVDPAASDQLLERVIAFARDLKRRMPVEKVYLFGSLARGEVHEGSDIDLLIVGEFHERFPYRASPILRMTDLPIEPLAYTPQELEEMKQAGNPFVLEVLRTGVRLA